MAFCTLFFTARIASISFIRNPTCQVKSSQVKLTQDKSSSSEAKLKASDSKSSQNGCYLGGELRHSQEKKLSLQGGCNKATPRLDLLRNIILGHSCWLCYPSIKTRKLRPDTLRSVATIITTLRATHYEQVEWPHTCFFFIDFNPFLADTFSFFLPPEMAFSVLVVHSSWLTAMTSWPAQS